ncbi:MAG TPA: N-acetylneuraminate synthase family protein [Pseudolabrys sp.]|nr:N-acetylneuraminate synthase family protein [Pseudolabrys sp.]
MLRKELTIGETSVGAAAAPYVIAEAGSNFNQDLDTARRLIDVAAEAGANAVKFQLFRADRLYPNGGELYDIFKSIELNSDWVPVLANHARERGLHFTASAFDIQSFEVLEAIGVPLHKVASSETTNLQFLHRVAASGKPVVISTGMCDMVDVEEAVNICLGVGNDQIMLLQCGAMYPLPPELANLRVLTSFAERFGCPVGFSDHTLGQATATAAVALGGTVFEKHFTLDRNAKGPDHFYALEPGELKAYVAALREAHQALGHPVKEMLPKERELGRREGLYAARAMKKDEIVTAADVVAKRPAIGLRARYASVVVGATVGKPVEKDQPLTWDVLTFGAKS